MLRLYKKWIWYLLLTLIYVVLLYQIENWNYEYRKKIELEIYRNEKKVNFSKVVKISDSLSNLYKPFPRWDTVSVHEPLTDRVLLRFYTDRSIQILIIQDTRNVVFSDSVWLHSQNPKTVSLKRTQEALVVVNHTQSVNIPLTEIHVADLYYNGWLNRVSVVRFVP